jgi:hypothetical protein
VQHIVCSSIECIDRAQSSSIIKANKFYSDKNLFMSKLSKIELY